jgi:hypothetical protein
LLDECFVVGATAAPAPEQLALRGTSLQQVLYNQLLAAAAAAALGCLSACSAAQSKTAMAAAHWVLAASLGVFLCFL